MKKFLFILMAFVATMVAKAEDYELYAVGTVTPNGENTISLMIKNKEPLQMVQGEITTPAGFTIESISSTCAIAGDGNYVSNGNFRFLFNAMTDVCIPASNEPQEIAKLTVTCTNLPTGQIQLINTGCKLAMYPSADPAQDSYEDIISYVKVQKAAVITPQRDDYAFEAVPTCVATGATSMKLPVNFANVGYVEKISFNIEYPEGMLTTKSGKNYPIDVNKERFDTGSDATLTVKATSGTAVSFTNGDSDLVEPGNGNLLSIPVTLTGVADGVYTIKFTDIEVSVTNDEADPISTETLPDYYVSVIVGQPKAQEVILYGKFNKDAADAFTAALKNVAIANTTGVKFGDGALIEDVILTHEPSNTSIYSRTSENFATTVLPYDLTTNPNCQLYTITEMTSGSIVIEEADNVSANTPCIFKGDLSAWTDEGGVPAFGTINDKVLSSTTFKGTYEATNIAAGAGYYIAANGKFYSDGATVRPFRAYFEGAIAGVKSFSINLSTPDGIIDITDQFSTEDIYSLQGIRTQSAKKGVNIIGGKKVYVK